jgi:hypothetical protein
MKKAAQSNADLASVTRRIADRSPREGREFTRATASRQKAAFSRWRSASCAGFGFVKRTSVAKATSGRFIGTTESRALPARGRAKFIRLIKLGYTAGEILSISPFCPLGLIALGRPCNAR